MNLKTHTVYPEIQYNDDSKSFIVRLYDLEGVVKFEVIGTAPNRNALRGLARAAIAKQAPHFLREINS